jgi:hypothetical protein
MNDTTPVTTAISGHLATLRSAKVLAIEGTRVMDKRKRDEILEAWDDAIGRIAREKADPTDDEMMAAEREVFTKVPGMQPGDISAALRSSTDELKGEVAQYAQLLDELERLEAAHDRLGEQIEKHKSGGGDPLPGLPGGRPLK